MLNSTSQVDLIYSEHFDSTKGNIIEVTDDFLDFIDSNDSLVITGNIEDDMILSTHDKTYKMRGINLPTTLLAVNQKGKIQLELNHFLKLQDYNHQYHKIYQKIKNQAPEQQQFDTLTLNQLIEKYGISDEMIRQKFKISLKQFLKFQEFVDFLHYNQSRLFVPLTILLRYMRNMLMYMAENNLMGQWFTYQQMLNFNPQIKCFSQFNQQLFKLVARKFKFDTQLQQNEMQKMQLQGQSVNQNHKQQSKIQEFKLTYQSVLNFILLQLAIAKPQYVSKQMDELIKDMLNVYIPIGMEVSQEQEQQATMKRVLGRYFIENSKNNTLVRTYYDPLQVESSLKGRIKFMSSFKSKFTRDEIRGVFEGMVLQQSSKEIKQLLSQGRRTIDMDDLLLKNFRKFNELYQIKMIFPK